MRHATLVPLLVGALLGGCSRPSGAAQDPSTPVAKVDGRSITEGELAAEAKAALAAVDAKYAEEVWNARSRALASLVERRLLEAKAAKEGISVDALVQREVSARVPEPDEAMLRGVYEQTKATGRPLPPFEQVRGEIAAFVKGQSADGQRQVYLAKLRSEAKVETLLPPLLLPKVEVKADGPSLGAADAPVTIVAFSDYQCEFCARAEPTLKQVAVAYPGKVRIVFQPYPLNIHPLAPKASEAAFCAGEQGKFWEMHDQLFANQKALAPDALKVHARAIGVDGEKFDACLDSGRTAPAVESSRKLGDGLGISSTPTFYVNGRPLTGALPFERFKELIDWELAHPAR